MKKIKMTTPLVEMDGDEMTRILWKMIKDELLTPFIDLKTEYYDLGLEHRNETNDQVTIDSAEATKKYGVAVKCATITPNAARMTEYNLKEMWKSPNGTIRAILDGTVFRAPILVKGIDPNVKSWKKPITIARHAYGDIYKNTEMKVNKGSKAELVVTDLRDRVRESGVKWNDVAILYRTNNQSQALENSLRQRGIPYLIYKGSSFYDHKEIKDTLAYIRLVINPKDDEAFKRVVNYPLRGIGDTTVSRIAQLAAERGQSMWESVDALVAEAATLGDPMQRTIARKVTEFVDMIRSLSLGRHEKELYDFGLEIASKSGISSSEIKSV